ncbi:MAG: hypothetical protein AAGJ18_30285, partial [Bacteroidota bacterium]
EQFNAGMGLSMLSVNGFTELPFDGEKERFYWRGDALFKVIFTIIFLKILVEQKLLLEWKGADSVAV